MAGQHQIVQSMSGDILSEFEYQVLAWSSWNVFLRKPLHFSPCVPHRFVGVITTTLHSNQRHDNCCHAFLSIHWPTFKINLSLSFQLNLHRCKRCWLTIRVCMLLPFHAGIGSSITTHLRSFWFVGWELKLSSRSVLGTPKTNHSIWSWSSFPTLYAHTQCGFLHHRKSDMWRHQIHLRLFSNCTHIPKAFLHALQSPKASHNTTNCLHVSSFKFPSAELCRSILL